MLEWGAINNEVPACQASSVELLFIVFDVLNVFVLVNVSM